jgi:hypothetical protein
VDLNATNINDKLVFALEYQLPSAYNMTDLSHNSWDLILQRYNFNICRQTDSAANFVFTELIKMKAFLNYGIHICMPWIWSMIVVWYVVD